MAKLAIYRLVVVMIGSLLTFAADAQLKLVVKPVDAETNAAAIDYKNSFRSRQELLDYLTGLPATLQAKGWLSASVDSIAENDSGFVAHVFLGRQYRWQELNVKPEHRQLLDELGYQLQAGSLADAGMIAGLPRAIISYYQDTGHPFARVGWDSIRLEDNWISASLRIDPGPLYRLDSVGLQGSARISRHFLDRYLGIPQESVYRRSVLDAIDQRLAELPYLQQSQPWQLQMHPTGYVINFYLEPRRSNTVDALIGFLPSNQQNGGRLLLTVDANLLLQNAFGGGELIDFSWEQIQPRSPRLNLAFRQPYIFRSAVGLDLGFHLYKKDSSFLNIDGRVAAQFSISNRQSVALMIQSQRTNLLDVDTTSIKFSKRLPDIIDLDVVSLGVEYAFRSTDYRFNPRRGAELSITTTAGRKTIRRNNAISQLREPGFNYNSLYDSLRLNSYQLRLRMSAANYFPLGRQSVLKAGLQAGLLQTPDYFRNEMFQVGGYRLLRGFDEESIFATRFAVATAEYRYLLNLNSYLFAFTDLGYTRFHNRFATESHGYLGFGAGMAFQARQGIFNISIAAGKRNDLDFRLGQTKIHIGYTSFF